MESGYTLCYAAKWYGEEEIFFESIQKQAPKTMLKKAHKLLDSADVVVHYNGSKFDIPTLNKEFIEYGFLPPAPYKEVDLLRTTRGSFRFPSNKLEYIAKALGIGEKVRHEGHDLWVKVMNNDPEAWGRMQDYNINDVLLLERLYVKLRPWIRKHPNYGLYGVGDLPSCPGCGGNHLHQRGVSRTSVSLFKRYQCQDCGTWSRAAITDTTREERQQLMRPA